MRLSFNLQLIADGPATRAHVRKSHISPGLATCMHSCNAGMKLCLAETLYSVHGTLGCVPLPASWNRPRPLYGHACQLALLAAANLVGSFRERRLICNCAMRSTVGTTWYVHAKPLPAPAGPEVLACTAMAATCHGL
jgi:hypothetical protein